MYVYRVTFLGGHTLDIRANSPKEAWIIAERTALEPIRMQYLRGK